MWRAPKLAWIAGAILLSPGSSSAQALFIEPDRSYHPEVSEPAYAETSGPVVGVSARDSLYTIDLRFQGFARLLRADGYDVRGFDAAFVPGCSLDLPGCAWFQALLQIDTLVIANRRDPISAEEAELLVGWLTGRLGCESGCPPRRLFLSAGHERVASEPVADPAAAVAELAARLELAWSLGSPDPRTFELTPPTDPGSQGHLLPHVILVGRADGESTPSIDVPAAGSTTFRLVAPPRRPRAPARPLARTRPRALAILRLPAGAPDAPAGSAQGMALELGSGRVYVSGDADMHTALIRAEGAFGMHRTAHNEQYLLNVMHWLDGLLPDADGDAFPDAVDNCVARANGPLGSNQLDADLDGFGNACDGDFDDDGDVDRADFASFAGCVHGRPAPPADPSCAEADLNGDGAADALDFTRIFLPLFGRRPGPSGLACAGAAAPAAAPCFTRTLADADGDVVANGDDSCVQRPNPGQLDDDLDGFGNACDGDFDNDGFVDDEDYAAALAPCLSRPRFTPGTLHDPLCTESDMDGDGFVDSADAEIFAAGLRRTGQPGPSGKACAEATSRSEPCQSLEAGQRSDPSYRPVLSAPEYAPRRGPLVAVDSTHDNYHVIGGRYRGFYELLTADGRADHGLAAGGARLPARLRPAAALPDRGSSGRGLRLPAAGRRAEPSARPRLAEQHRIRSHVHAEPSGRIQPPPDGTAGHGSPDRAGAARPRRGRGLGDDLPRLRLPAGRIDAGRRVPAHAAAGRRLHRRTAAALRRHGLLAGNGVRVGQRPGLRLRRGGDVLGATLRPRVALRHARPALRPQPAVPAERPALARRAALTQVPVNLGARFSTKAFIPSLASLLRVTFAA
jgi:hypothetical protein